MSAPLASWNDTPTKTAIVDFVQRTTTEGSADYLAPNDRIAVFDNDGTLWTEQPAYNQLLFAIDRLKVLAPDHPEWKDDPALGAILSGDMAAFGKTGMKGIFTLVAATHAGISTEDFGKIVRDWIATAKHPVYKRPYPATSFEPMLELLDYLRANGYITFIVSGGGVEFMRAFTQEAYGVPPHQVIGSTGKTEFKVVNGAPVLVKLPELDAINDGPGKPVGIDKFLGAARSWPLAIPMAIWRCCNTPPPATAPGSWRSCITTTPSARRPMTRARRSVRSTKPSPKRRSAVGLSSA